MIARAVIVMNWPAERATGDLPGMPPCGREMVIYPRGLGDLAAAIAATVAFVEHLPRGGVGRFLAGQRFDLARRASVPMIILLEAVEDAAEILAHIGSRRAKVLVEREILALSIAPRATRR
jgi:hypothetical protein